MKDRFNKGRAVIINYFGDLNNICDGLKILKKYNGRAVIEVDTSKISVSKSIAFLSSIVEINDVEVSTTTVEDVVVGLYKEYNI